MSRLKLNVWGTIEFKKNFDLNYCVDTTELLKDSAISPPMEHWHSVYDHCAFKNLYGKNKPKGEDEIPIMKRVMLRNLSGQKK